MQTLHELPEFAFDQVREQYINDYRFIGYWSLQMCKLTHPSFFPSGMILETAELQQQLQ